jgi:hypothetical protein
MPDHTRLDYFSDGPLVPLVGGDEVSEVAEVVLPSVADEPHAESTTEKVRMPSR